MGDVVAAHPVACGEGTPGCMHWRASGEQRRMHTS